MNLSKLQMEPALCLHIRTAVRLVVLCKLQTAPEQRVHNTAYPQPANYQLRHHHPDLTKKSAEGGIYLNREEKEIKVTLNRMPLYNA